MEPCAQVAMGGQLGALNFGLALSELVTRRTPATPRGAPLLEPPCEPEDAVGVADAALRELLLRPEGAPLPVNVASALFADDCVVRSPRGRFRRRRGCDADSLHESRRRRGYDVDIPWRRVARGYDADIPWRRVARGFFTRTFRGDESRRRHGRDADIPWRHVARGCNADVPRRRVAAPSRPRR